MDSTRTARQAKSRDVNRKSVVNSLRKRKELFLRFSVCLYIHSLANNHLSYFHGSTHLFKQIHSPVFVKLS